MHAGVRDSSGNLTGADSVEVTKRKSTFPKPGERGPHGDEIWCMKKCGVFFMPSELGLGVQGFSWKGPGPRDLGDKVDETGTTKHNGASTAGSGTLEERGISTVKQPWPLTSPLEVGRPLGQDLPLRRRL